MGRDTWKTLIGSQGTLQTGCTIQGFNSVCSHGIASRARVGIIANENGLATLVIPESGLAQEGISMTVTRVGT